jgi:hypothetical protein
MQVKETRLWEELYAAAVLESDPNKISESNQPGVGCCRGGA